LALRLNLSRILQN